MQMFPGRCLWVLLVAEVRAFHSTFDASLWRSVHVEATLHVHAPRRGGQTSSHLCPARLSVTLEFFFLSFFFFVILDILLLKPRPHTLFVAPPPTSTSPPLLT